MADKAAPRAHLQSTGGGVVAPGAGREFDSGRSRPRIKIADAPERSFAVFEAEQQVGTPGPPAHVHRRYDEAWYVLAGTMDFVLDGTAVRCTTGAVAFAPRGTSHTFHNAGSEPARLLAITTPGALSLIEELGKLVAHGPPDPVALHALLASP